MLKFILSPATVRKHIENIYTKLQVHNKLEAVQKAAKEQSNLKNTLFDVLVRVLIIAIYDIINLTK